MKSPVTVAATPGAGSMTFKWPAVIFLFSILTHLPGITNPILDYHTWAQTLRASIARNYSQQGMDFFQPRVDFRQDDDRFSATQFPLYSYLIAAAYRLFGDNDVWGRVLSALFAGMGAVFLFLLVGKFLGERIAIVSALVYCCIPVRIYFMRAVMPESMALFGLVAGFYYVVLWMESGRFFRHGLLGCVLLSLAPLLKIPYLPLVVPAFFLVYKKSGYGIVFRKETWIMAGMLSALVSGWYLYTMTGAPTLVSEQGLPAELDLASEWLSLRFWKVHFLSRFPELLTTYAGLLFFFIGGMALWKESDPLRRERGRFFLFWFATTVVFIVLCGKYGRIHQYASLPFAPVNAVLIGAGIVRAWELWRPAGYRKVLFAALLLSIPVHAGLRIRHWYCLDDQWVLRAREVVENVSRPDDLFHVNSQIQPSYLYHIRRKGFVGHLLGAGLARFEDNIRNGAKFLLTPARIPGMEWSTVEAEFDRRFRRVLKDPEFLIYDLRKF